MTISFKMLISSMILGLVLGIQKVECTKTEYTCNSDQCPIVRENLNHIDGEHAIKGRGDYHLMVCETASRNHIAVSVTLEDAMFDILDVNGNSVIPDRSPTHEYTTGEYIVMTDTTSTMFTLVYHGENDNSSCNVNYVRLNY